MKKIDFLKSKLQKGRVYRRQDLALWSTSIDRHLKELVQDGTLTKLSGGLYACPQKTTFGEVLPDDTVVIKKFLKGDSFLKLSPNDYNLLGLGTTQLYQKTVVYNRKRHQPDLKIGTRIFDFHQKRDFPAQLTKEFLLVDLIDHLHLVAEDPTVLLDKIKQKIHSNDFDCQKIQKYAQKYISPTARNLVEKILCEGL